MMLANASHELRTPALPASASASISSTNARTRTARRELRADIAELDRLIDEILLASRLDASPALGRVEEVDLQALCAEECARFDDCEFTRRQRRSSPATRASSAA